MFEEQLSRLSVEPPRSIKDLPGLRLREQVSTGLVLSAAFPLLFFGVIPVTMLLSVDTGTRIALGSSTDVAAQVTASMEDANAGGARRIVYEFNVPPAGKYTGADTLRSQSPYRSARVGDTVMVRYLNSDPSVNRIAGAHSEDPPLAVFFLMFPFFGLAIGGGMLSPYLAPVLRARRLFRRGRLASAAVVFVRREAATPWMALRSPPMLVFVRMETAPGTTIESQTTCANDWLLQHLPPGARVTVAYLPQKPQQCVLLDQYVR